MKRWTGSALAPLLASAASALAGSPPSTSSTIDARMLVDLDLLSDARFAAHADASRAAEIERDRELLDHLDWLEQDDEPSRDAAGARRR